MLETLFDRERISLKRLRETSARKKKLVKINSHPLISVSKNVLPKIILSK